MALIARHLQLGPWDNNVWVLTCPATRQTAVLDVGFEPERVIDLVRREQLDVRWLLGTHAHIDHAMGMGEVQQAVGGVYALHPLDQPLLDAMPQQALMFGLPPVRAIAVGHALVDGETLHIGDEPLEVVFTPGHAPGHVVFRQGAHVWCGDTVFADSIGRTDLPGGDLDTLVRSIHERLFTLPDDTVLHPGHGPDTTVGRERIHNPFVGKAAGY